MQNLTLKLFFFFLKINNFGRTWDLCDKNKEDNWQNLKKKIRKKNNLSSHFSPAEGLKGTVVNQACYSLSEGYLELSLQSLKN